MTRTCVLTRDIVMFFPSRETVSREKSRASSTLQPQHTWWSLRDEQCSFHVTPVVMKLRNHPTVGFDHWKIGSLMLVAGVRLSSGVKKAEPTLEVRTNGVLEGNKESGRIELERLETAFQSPVVQKSCVISSELKPEYLN
ncbi:hypothetical protein AVEN_37403-1 [Araneus ventricosus]|uniref:Uncharacterized protein n=1 Tax=Araneus ventricosus TaxID=182803 RepID=A0A4Y2M3K3_ARAVE|nr:hypothetical protein AVEN_37403-1 [Araneus ventricosus]